MPLVPV
jgi:hypothetical protein